MKAVVEGVQTAARAGASASQPQVAATAPGEAGAAKGVCPSCGASLVGDYCHACGEKHPQARDLTLRHFAGDAARELTSLDSKLFRTLFTLLVRPGRLTNEWIAGRRVPYIKPLNLCLGILALNFFAYSVYKPVSMFDIGKFIKESKREDSMKVFERFAAKKQTTVPELFDRLAEKWQRNVSFSTLLLVGVYALVLQLVFLLRRRYFVEHLVFSMHFISFSALAVLLLWPVYYSVGIKTGGVNTVVGLFKWALDIVYMFFAVRAVYGLGRGRTLLASVVLVVGYFISYGLVLVGALIAAIISIGLS